MDLFEESMKKFEESMEKLSRSVEVIQNQALMNIDISSALERIYSKMPDALDIHSKVVNLSFNDLLANMIDSTNSIFNNYISILNSQFNYKYDFSKIFSDFLHGLDYNTLVEYAENQNISLENYEQLNDDLTQEREYETIKYTQEELNNDDFQKKAYNWTEKQKKKNYLWYIIIILLFNIFILPYLQEKGLDVMTRIESWIRKNPDKKSEVIEVIEDNTRCTVVEDIPYWIKIKWNENGVEKTGWIAKRNIYYIKEDE